jgi:hypothetical protein
MTHDNKQKARTISALEGCCSQLLEAKTLAFLTQKDLKPGIFHMPVNS